MNNLQVRRFEPADEAAFCEMAEEFYHSEAVLHPIPPERHHWAFQEILRSDQYLGGYIFLDGSKPAGFVVTNRTMQHEAGGVLVWLEEIYSVRRIRAGATARRQSKPCQKISRAKRLPSGWK